jgi:hypothetical protein
MNSYRYITAWELGDYLVVERKEEKYIDGKGGDGGGGGRRVGDRQ